LPLLTRLRKQVTVDSAPVPARVVADAEPYYGGEGPLGVVLCHGFTGSPRSMRAWAEHLEADGFRVALPRLPGHGTSWQELNSTEWTDWYAVVERDFQLLRKSCERVFVCGLSMGGCLALRLAEQSGDGLAGIAVVNPAVRLRDWRLPALPLLRRMTPSLNGIASDIAMPQVDEDGYTRTPLHAMASQVKMWHDVRANLSRIQQPLLLFRSRQDHVLDPGSARTILEEIRSHDAQEIILERSYHVATMDYDAEEIFTVSSAFFRRLAVA
jgi:carboxylesterase